MRRLTFTVCVLMLLSLTGCKTNTATGRRQLLLVSAETTTQMGIDAKPEMIKQYGGEYASPELRAYIDRVGHALLGEVEPEYADNPWEFILLNSDVINAFALPGGKVFITIGLLKHFTNEAEVAGVLGHEIGHVTARHVDERISQSMVVQGLVSVADASTDSALAVAVLGGAGQGYLLKYGRGQELEADMLGIKYMSRARYDPIGMRQVLEVLMSVAGGSRAPEILSTHPYPERRLEQVDSLLSGQYANTQGNSEYSTYEIRFQRDAVPHLPASSARLDPNLDGHGYCLVCRGEESGS